MKHLFGAAAICAALASPAFAGMHSSWPGELVMPTETSGETLQYFQQHPDEFPFSLVPCTVTVDGRHVPAYAVVPADDPQGHPLNTRQAATRLFETRKHWGIFDTKAHAIQHVRWMNEPLGADQ